MSRLVIGALWRDYKPITGLRMLTMSEAISQGAKLRQAAARGPTQIVGVINAFFALMAERAGLRAIYLSGGAQSACMGLPDLGLLTLADVAETARQITEVCALPLLVDGDSGFGNTLAIARAAKILSKSGAAGMHLEDQEDVKRCGHRPNKTLCSGARMCGRIKAAVDGRGDDSFVIMARTDALADEGLPRTIERIVAYVEAGADMIFLEAAEEVNQYGAAAAAVSAPLLANMTEFGLTPLLELAELDAQGVALVLYPLTPFRVMARAAEEAYACLRSDGSQKALVTRMQSRQDLYELIGYYEHERLLDEDSAATLAKETP